MKAACFLVCFFILNLVAAQSSIPARDTSFSIQATFIKESKKFPFIKIAEPIKLASIKQVNNIAYRNINGRKLLLDIYFPETEKNKVRPAVLLVFGGGWRSGDKSHNHAMATVLANEGYVAVSAEYRLSTEAIFPAALHDLKNAVRWMRVNALEYGIDTSRIAVLGCSAGGQLAALMGVTNYKSAFEESNTSAFSSAVHAVINIDGILAFKHPESSEGASASLWLGGTYEQNPESWTNASPLTHVSQTTVPFSFINSSIPRFHSGRDDMIAMLKSLGIYWEVHTMPNTPHPFWFFHPWFDPMMQHILDFLRNNLK